MAGSSSGRKKRSNSPLSNNKKSSSSSYSTSSSSSIIMNGKNTILPRSCSSSSSSSLYGSGNGIGNSGSMTPIHGQNDPMYNGLVEYGSNIPIGGDELIGPETIDTSASGDSISVTVRFRPLSEREFQRGDEIAWYPDGDKIVRNEHNPAIAYAFGIASEFMM